MTVSSQGRTAQGIFRCPTCKAQQEWSDVCRRCKCDLTLLRRATAAAQRSRRRSLLHLRARRLSEALWHARRAYRLLPDDRSARLLAVCYLLSGNWSRAIALARAAAQEP